MEQFTPTPIKTIIKQSKVRQWQIAEFLDIDESQFSKSLRYEPDAEYRKQILDAIKQIQTKR